MSRDNSPLFRNHSSQQRFLETALVLICLALCWLLYMIGDYRMVVLHLFYLPVVLAAFFLGRYLAGVLALLCAVGAAVVLTADVTTAVSFNSPLVVWLALAIWSAVLGLTAIMAGTLSDERAAKIAELHDAYVGVVEVLSHYLNSADAKANHEALQVSQLGQQVAGRLGLPSEEIDHIRVAALLQDINHMEITAKVLRRAVGNLQQAGAGKHTFHGRDLLCSLGDVLSGTWPLLLDQGDGLAPVQSVENKLASGPAARGASILRTVKRYVTLAQGRHPVLAPREAIDALRDDVECDHDPAVVRALEWVVVRLCDAAQAEPELCRV
jgi:K+-sensing histidine kinase KdpD